MRISDWSSDVCSSDLCARSCRVLAQALGQAVDPAGDLLERLVAGQVDVDRGDRDVTGAHGVEVGAGAAVELGACRADPPPVASARVLLLDAGFGAVAVAQARDLETGRSEEHTLNSSH